jgi:hypothetical protein
MAGESKVHDALVATRRSAVHLEMRDGYTTTDPAFIEWRGGTGDPAQRYRSWSELIVATVARGVSVRRARIVSEPLSEYIRFEYDVTAEVNVAAGEDVRWLPRRRVSDLALPGNDFWLFDGELVIFNHFAGDGSPGDPFEEVSTDPAVVARCGSAFEGVWERAVPHGEYRPE